MAMQMGGALIPIRDTSWSERSRYVLRRGTTRIGRAVNSHVCINSASVSRVHAELIWTDDGLVLYHRSTTNNTIVNDLPVADSVLLSGGDVIEFGHGPALRLELFGDTDDVATTPVSSSRRQIQAILYADVAGFTRLTSENEAETAQRMQKALTFVHEKTRGCGGKVANVAGDGVLALFSSVVAALEAAVAIQQAQAETNSRVDEAQRLEFRIGLNSGDIIFSNAEAGENLFGDSINVAARVQEIAPPGGILLTGAVYDQIHGVASEKFDIRPMDEARIIDRRLRLFSVYMPSEAG